MLSYSMYDLCDSMTGNRIQIREMGAKLVGEQAMFRGKGLNPCDC